MQALNISCLIIPATLVEGNSSNTRVNIYKYLYALWMGGGLHFTVGVR